MFSMQKCVPSLQEAKLEDKKGSLRKEISLVRTNTSVDVPNRRRHDAKNSYLTWLYLLTLRLCEFSPLETVAKGGEKVNTGNVCGKNVSSCNSLGCALFQCRQGPNDVFKEKMYRVTHLSRDYTLLTVIWEFHHVAYLQCQFCQICSCPIRIEYGRHRNYRIKVNKMKLLTWLITLYCLYTLVK